MAKRAILIINSKAGMFRPGRKKLDLDALQRWFSAVDMSVEVRSVKSFRASDLAQDKPDLLVAAGGDGTISAVAAVACQLDIPLGVLPLGTFNHFAKDLNLPLDSAAAVAMMLQGDAAKIDVAELNGHYFLNNSSVGVYPEMVKHRDQQFLQTRRNKWLALMVACGRLLWRFPLQEVKLITEQGELQLKTPLVFVGNNHYRCGFNAGRQCLSEGKLCVYVVKSCSRLAVLRLLWRIWIRGLSCNEDLLCYRVQQLKIEFSQPEARVAMDGEVYWLQSPLCYRNGSKKLQVMGVLS